MEGKPIIVMGSSAGGLDALKRVVAQLPKEFPAPIFVVDHMAADGDASILSRTLSRSGELPCSQARDEEEFRPGHIYVALADHHMLLEKEVIRITKGRGRTGLVPVSIPSFAPLQWPTETVSRGSS